jgi:hypothetical protein
MNSYHVQINGSTDARQMRRVETDLRHLSGVIHASAVADTGHVTVQGPEGLLPLIENTVRRAGYELASDHTTRAPMLARWYRHGWLTEPSRAA